MAKDKRSFLLYTDLIHTVSQLPDDTAGILFKHILEYVNDKEPVANDIVVKIAFEPIKQGLKRDLKKYEEIKKKRSKAGKASALKRQQESTCVEDVEQNEQELTHIESAQQSSTKSTVSDNVSVSVNDNVLPNGNKKVSKDTVAKAPIFFFKTELLNLGIEKQLAEDWIKVRKLKKAANTRTAFDALVKQFEKSGLSPSECVKIAVENSWSGFNASWLEKKKAKQSPGQKHYQTSNNRECKDW